MNQNTNPDLQELAECESKISVFENALRSGATAATRADIEPKLTELRGRKEQILKEINRH